MMLLILSIAYALLLLSVDICAFQSSAPSLVVVRITNSSTDGNGRIAMAPDEQAVGGVDLYNDDGEEIDDVQIDVENIKDIQDEDDIDASAGGKDESAGEENNNPKHLIECSTSIMLPFSEQVAFEAFSDLTRQPSWCSYLHSVEYIGLVPNQSEDAAVPLRESKWTVGVRGLRFSWTANDTRIVRPNRIEWESTSGMKNYGSVDFKQQQSSSSSPIETQMTLCFTFVAPRVVSALFRRIGRIRRYVEDKMLATMLQDFRDVVLEEDL